MKKIFSNQKTPILQSKITKNPSPLTSLLIFLFSLLPSALFGQVTIGKNEEPKPYSVLELYGQYETGSFGGFRLPQLTTPQRDALVLDSDAPGLMIFNTTTECMEMWNGAKWISFCDDAGGEGGTAYVEINGIKWAKTNLGAGGVFCANPEDYGALYQWGRHTDGHESRTPDPLFLLGPISGTNLDGNGQPTGSYRHALITGSVDWRTPQKDNLWNSGAELSPIKTVNDPCPAGWRVPTQTELNSLTNSTYVNRVWTTNYLGSGISGYLLTNNPDDGNTIFFPAAGRRYYVGSLGEVGTSGYYWSSTPDNNLYACLLGFGNDFFSTTGEYDGRAFGLSVRCVAEF